MEDNFDPTKATPPMADISWVKRKYLDIPYGVSPSQAIDIYLPDEGDGPFPLVVHIHGGGFAFGNKRDDHMNAYLGGIQLGFAVASVEYRLSGEAVFPAAVIDCREAIRFLKEHSEQYSIDPERIGLIGGSAGGNLCAMLAMNVPDGEFPGEDRSADYRQSAAVKTAVCQFGPMNFLSMEAQARTNGISATHDDPADMPESAYIGAPVTEAAAGRITQANPATYASDAMCPILVQHGTRDHLVPFEQSVEFVNAVFEKAGGSKITYVPLVGADHEDRMFTSEPNMGFVWEYLREHLKQTH